MDIIQLKSLHVYIFRHVGIATLCHLLYLLNALAVEIPCGALLELGTCHVGVATLCHFPPQYISSGNSLALWCTSRELELELNWHMPCGCGFNVIVFVGMENYKSKLVLEF